MHHPSRALLLGGAAAAGLAICWTPAPAEPRAALAPNEILRRAGAAPGLRSYAVPVTFAVHLKRPVGVRSTVEGVVYYQAPSDAALVITSARGLIGRFFRGTYAIDLAPQVWPQKYVATSSRTVAADAGPAYELQARPMADPTIDDVRFTVAKATLEPVAASWHYTDGSTIAVTIVNRIEGRYRLPQSESIALSLPKYALDATCTYGDYALNATVPSGAFK